VVHFARLFLNTNPDIMARNRSPVGLFGQLGGAASCAWLGFRHACQSSAGDVRERMGAARQPSRVPDRIAQVEARAVPNGAGRVERNYEYERG
jgi:hypothetical protein